MKKTIAGLCACVLAFTGFAGSKEINGYTWYYEESKGAIMIKGVSPECGDIKIPSEINGIPVTRIGTRAFVRCKDVNSIKIPDSVIRIDNNAFDDTRCTSVGDWKEIKLFDRKTVYGLELVDGWVVRHDSAKWDCQISSYTIDGVRGIADGAVAGSWLGSDLERVVLGKGIRSIGDKAFANNEKLKSITFPDSVTHFGNQIFYGCRNIDETIVEVSDRATWCSKWLTYHYGAQCDGKVRIMLGKDEISEASIPRGTTTIQSGEFKGCVGLTSVIIPDSVTNISTAAFAKCSNLQSVLVPSSVRNIEYGAFEDCQNLSSVTLEANVTKIDDWTFKNCKSLNTISIPDTVMCIGNEAFNHCENLTSITIPHSVRYIGNNAFEQCENLTSVTIPDSVKNMGSAVFAHCFHLKTVKLSSNLNTIDQYAFSECKALREIIIPKSVSKIKWSAFSKCLRLKKVTILNDDVDIEEYAFANCPNLKAINTPEDQLDPATFNK